MSKALVILNLALLALTVFFARDLARELAATRPIPVPPQPRAAASAPADEAPPERGPRPDLRPLYGVIAQRNLFSPTRTEAVAAATPTTAPPQPKPYLHGVVLDDSKSRAYLEDPTSKRIFGYTIGDTVSGGRLETIQADRVVIARPDGPIEVMLRDPAKPRPAPPPQAAQPRQPGVGPAVQPSAVGVPPAVRGQQPPRPLQSLPSQVLRRLAPSGDPQAQVPPQPEAQED